MFREELLTPDLTAVEMLSSELLPTEDGEPLESPWHRAEINLLIESLDYHWRGRTDYYAGGNMFIYFSMEQVRRRDYRGPDFFVVKDVDGTKERGAWVVWEEGKRYPNLIIELLSPSTAEADKTIKKRLYERTFRTAEYYWYDPTTQELIGWRLWNQRYEEIEPNQSSRLWSQELGLEIGLWEGKYLSQPAVWLRFFDEEGQIVPIMAELVKVQAARAEQEEARAEWEAAARRTAEAEVARLQEELARLRGN